MSNNSNNSNKPSKIIKHRPYLSELAIRWIYNESSKQRLESEEANLVFIEIASFAINLDASKLKGSYTTKPREDLLTSLGGSTKIEESTFIDPNTHKLIAYNKYKDTPDSCTEDELLTAVEYKEIVLKESLTSEEQEIINKSWGM